jgi:hypothetical protein
MVFHRWNGEIAWSCDVCGDEGVITGWQSSPFDVSGLDDSYGDVDGWTKKFLDRVGQPDERVRVPG